MTSQKELEESFWNTTVADSGLISWRVGRPVKRHVEVAKEVGLRGCGGGVCCRRSLWPKRRLRGGSRELLEVERGGVNFLHVRCAVCSVFIWGDWSVEEVNNEMHKSFGATSCFFKVFYENKV